MRHTLLGPALIAALLGCGSGAGGGNAGANGGGGASSAAGTNGSGGATGSAGTNGAAGATGSAGTNGGAGATGSAGTNGAAGKGGVAGKAGAAGAGGAGSGATAGATGAAGSGGAASALAAGTYAGTAATGADCVGFSGLTGCPVQITITGSGPTYQVTDFMLPGGISGSGVSVTQTGDSVAVDLLTGSTVDFCPAAEYTGAGTVDAGGASMSVTLSGPPCGSSDSVLISVTLTKS
jgi:hypothetical protein